MQLDIGSDIIMLLDVCPPAGAGDKESKKAVELTLEWARRSKIFFSKKLKSYPDARVGIPHPRRWAGHRDKLQANRPLLFSIVQGGTDLKLREYCATQLMKMNFSAKGGPASGWDGYAIGGLAVGEEKNKMWQVVRFLNEILPQDKPRYLMGVGTPNDIIKATSLGIDMFDCVLPTRLARHGVAFIGKGRGYKDIDFRKAKLKNDRNPIDKNCGCPVCQQNFSRAYLHHLVKIEEILGIRLLTQHNLYTYFDLMKKIRSLKG
jgi:queuine tRNA-ribosyltransferase